MQAAEGRHFGWKPPSGELARKFSILYGLRLPLQSSSGALPSQIDLRPTCPPIYDQGLFSACTANAVAGMIHYFRIKEGLQKITPSRLYIYWFERLGAGEQGQDDGGSVGAAVDAVVRSGYCAENVWPYIKANLFVSPPAAEVTEGARHSITLPVSLSGLQEIKLALSQAQPVAFGLWLYNSFFDADINGGIVPMPDTSEPNEKHAGLLVGYDDNTQKLIMRNSWGLSTSSGRPCGDKGYYYLPYDYIGEGLSTDFWTISSVSDLS